MITHPTRDQSSPITDTLTTDVTFIANGKKLARQTPALYDNVPFLRYLASNNMA